jgi:tartrate-resistant acid phosphatase type 5
MRFFAVYCFVATIILWAVPGSNGLRPASSLISPEVRPDQASIAASFLQTNNLITTVRFAVIGDYGESGANEAAVAALVKSWNPDFIITTGDNNYPDGTAETIDQNIGQYYHSFIHPYVGAYGSGATTNRFFPSLGNHDWRTAGALPYLNYFTLPGNERYYDFTRGVVHFFAVDSDPNEPDGILSNSTQASWLQNRLATSASCWDLVYFHHAAFSSGQHGSFTAMQWPFQTWGADAVLMGHDHDYERIVLGGFPYFVNGAGGAGIRTFKNPPTDGSQVRYNSKHGAMLVTATATTITYQFVAVDGQVVDTFSQSKACSDKPYRLYLPVIYKRNN